MCDCKVCDHIRSVKPTIDKVAKEIREAKPLGDIDGAAFLLGVLWALSGKVDEER